MSVRVHEGAREISQARDVLLLEEARTYLVSARPGATAPRAWLGARALPRDDATGAFTMQIGQWVGSSTLCVTDDAGDVRLAVEVLPRAEKLDPAAWLALLNDLESWTPGLAVGLEGGGVGDVGNAGTTAPVLAAALLPLVPALVEAVRAIASAPREHAVPAREDIRLRNVRRAARDTLQWMARHPAAAAALDPWVAARAGAQDPYVPQNITQEALDHPVNRYLAWLITRVTHVLAKLAGELSAAATAVRGSRPDTADWCQARAIVAVRAADELRSLLRRTVFGALTPAPATEAALLAVQDDPAYARAHACARPFLSPRFRLPDAASPTPAAVRPSFDLYELWVFLAVQRALGEVLRDWTWKWHPQPRDALLAGLGVKSRFTAVRADGARIQLVFNLTFRGYLAGRDGARFSLSRERRHDLVLTYAPPAGAPTWMFLDAKYRVSRENLGDAFESAHLYRDSLRWPAFGGPCRGGLLLVPAMAKECEPWFEKGFREAYGIGVWRLTPGEPASAALAEVLLTMLGVVPEERA